MDLWKLLILGVVILGLFLVLGGPPARPELPAGPLVETGTFRILTPKDSREEIFGIYAVDAGFRVVSILHEGGKILVEADLVYTPSWEPLAGTITQRVPQEVRWLFAFTEEEVVVRRQVGPRETSETLAISQPAFPLDLDLFATWDALFRAAPKEEVQLLDLRQETMYTISISSPEDTNLRVLGRAIPVQRLRVSGKDWTLDIYRQGELLLGVRGPELHAFLVEVLPEGIQEIP